MDPIVEIHEPKLDLHFVVLPRHAIHASGGPALERQERRPEHVDVDVVQERGEPFRLPLPRGLPYAPQRLCHAGPALGPERALPVCVPLGSRPWLHRLRPQLPGFVRRLHGYYAGIRLLPIVHRRLRLPAFPPRTDRPSRPSADREISRFPYKERPQMPGSTTTPGRTGARDDAPVRFAFRLLNAVGARDM